MKKFGCRLLCCFIPSRRVRHRFRSYVNSSPIKLGETIDKGKNNKIIIIARDGTHRIVPSVPRSVIKFTGSNNCVELYEPIGRLELNIDAANNLHIVIEPCGCQLKLRIYQYGSEIGSPTRGNLVHVGRGCTSTNWLTISVMDDGGDVRIGDDCQFSWGDDIRTGDFHTILKQGTDEIINYSKDVIVGNHVWLGSDVCLLKGAVIPDNSIVGMHSLVTKKFTETNTIIAGSPARVIRTCVDWSRKSIMEYEKKK